MIKIINVLVWVLLIKISSSILDPTSLGNFFIFFTFASIFAIILTGWQSSSSLRFYHNSNNKYELVRTLLNSIIYNYKILSALIFSLLLISYYLNKNDFLNTVLVFYFFTVSYSFFLFIISILRIQRNFKLYLKILITHALVLILTLVYLINIFNWTGIIISFSLSYFLSSLFYLFIKRKIINKLIAQAINKSLQKEMLHYGLPVVLIGVFTLILSGVDQFFLKIYGFNNEVGIYASNYSIAEKTIFVVLSVFASAFTPKLFKEYSEKKIDLLKQIKKGVKQFLIFSAPILLILVFFSKTLSRLFLDVKFVVGHWIIPIIALSAVVMGFSSFYSEILTVNKKTKLLAYCYGLGALFNIVLNVIFVPYYDIVATTFSTFLSYVFLFILIYHCSIKILRVNNE